MSENLGTISQPLVTGSLVPVDMQEQFRLLTFTSQLGGGLLGTCSASLLRNNWAICAAHCVEIGGISGATTPDPVRPGQNMLLNPANVSLTAAWGGGQTRKAVQIQTFRPYDIAIIRVEEPFIVSGFKDNVSTMIFQDNQFPYFGSYPGAVLLLFGRGINQFAFQTPAGVDMPSVSDGAYRMGSAKIDEESDNRVWYSGSMVAGGDSGGPSFAWTLNGWALTGVHSLTTVTFLPGHEGTPGYKWVTQTPRAGDAPVKPVWDDILTFMGAMPTGITWTEGTFPPPTPNKIPAFIYGVATDGRLLWYRHDGAHNGEGTKVVGSWKGPGTIDGGWSGLKSIFPGDGNIIYAIANDGSLHWYRHDEFNTGQGIQSGGWAPGSGKIVGNGWQNFRHVFSGGKGVIYAIEPNGDITWYKHVFSRTGEWHEAPGAWLISNRIGNGWQQFINVFSGGDGIIYAITADGILKWYKHTGFETGAATWEGPHDVGNDWHNFSQVFSAGNPKDGIIIYGVTEAIVSLQAHRGSGLKQRAGDLVWYKHKGYQTGTKVWEGGKKVGNGWSSMAHLFALLPGTPAVIH